MRIVLLLLLLFALLPIKLFGDDKINHELFFRAHEAYDHGLYDEAITLYPKNIMDGQLLYNLGNFYFKKGEIGNSIFYFKMAKRLIPRDADLNFNLDYARKQVKDSLEDKRSVIHKLVDSSLLSFIDTIIIFTLFSVLFFSLSILLLYFKNEWLIWPRRVCLPLFVLSLFNVYLSYNQQNANFGVVLAANANVYSGVGKGDVVLFELHEGTEFSVNDKIDISEERWYEIGLVDGKKGWIKSASVRTLL